MLKVAGDCLSEAVCFDELMVHSGEIIAPGEDMVQTDELTNATLITH